MLGESGQNWSLAGWVLSPSALFALHLWSGWEMTELSSYTGLAFPPSLDHLPLFLLLFIFLCLLSSSSFLLLSSCLYLFLCLYYSRLPQFMLNGMHSCNIYFLILTNVCNPVSNPLTKGIKTEYVYTSQELFLSLSGQSPSPRQHLLWILPT